MSKKKHHQHADSHAQPADGPEVAVADPGPTNEPENFEDLIETESMDVDDTQDMSADVAEKSPDTVPAEKSPDAAPAEKPAKPARRVKQDTRRPSSIETMDDDMLYYTMSPTDPGRKPGSIAAKSLDIIKDAGPEGILMSEFKKAGGRLIDLFWDHVYGRVKITTRDHDIRHPRTTRVAVVRAMKEDVVKEPKAPKEAKAPKEPKAPKEAKPVAERAAVKTQRQKLAEGVAAHEAKKKAEAVAG